MTPRMALVGHMCLKADGHPQDRPTRAASRAACSSPPEPRLSTNASNVRRRQVDAGYCAVQ